MDKNFYFQVRKNWDYLHPLTKSLTLLDYQFEKLLLQFKQSSQRFLNKLNPKFLYWSPRGLAILYILFLAIFALDVFIPNQTLSYYLVAFFMHLIPNFILLILLLISWKNEKLGSLLFLLSYVILLIWSRSLFGIQTLLFSPLLIISLLFFLHTSLIRRRL